MKWHRGLAEKMFKDDEIPDESNMFELYRIYKDTYYKKKEPRRNVFMFTLPHYNKRKEPVLDHNPLMPLR